jgi:NADPH2:quinone reductase
MKALRCHAFGPINTLRVDELPSPSPAAGQVLVDVHAASINFPDALMVQGLYQVKPPLPFTPGAELAGVVSALGEGVTRLKVGDRVVCSTGTGAFAEQAVVDAAKAIPLPEGMDYAAGASFVLVYGTSLHALQTIGKLQPGETLLVLGAAGGVGIAAIEIAKAMGARVIAAASSDEKRALAKQAGADETVDYTQPDWRREVERLTGGQGANVVYDAVGGDYAEPALRATAWRGRYLVVGFAAGDIPKLPLNLALLKERSILGVFWGAAMAREPQQLMADLTQLAGWFRADKVKPPVTEQVTLDQAADAIERLATRRAMGKIVVLPRG